MVAWRFQNCANALPDSPQQGNFCKSSSTPQRKTEGVRLSVQTRFFFRGHFRLSFFWEILSIQSRARQDICAVEIMVDEGQVGTAALAEIRKGESQ